jgi:hypothetical protein
LIAPGAGAKGVERGAEGTRPLRRLSPTRMPSIDKTDPAPVCGQRYSFATRRSAPGKTDTKIKYMIAPARVVVDGVNPVEKEFITIAEIQKREIMHKEFNPALRSDGAGDVAIVPHQSDEPAEIRNNDIGDMEMVIDERRRGSDPKITMDKI